MTRATPAPNAIGEFPRRSGTCRKVVDGKVCGKPFYGAAVRKYCDEHCEVNKYRGRDTPQGEPR